MIFDPRNILVIDFGQLGDVVLSLPALRALREHFPNAHITVAVGRSAAPIVEFTGFANRTLPVDRVALRDGPKPLALWRIARLVRDVRRTNFDFVIDLHSLSETNILGRLSKAPMRLYARRPGRSIDYLSNYRPRPPIEDLTLHATDRYLQVLEPLELRHAERELRLHPRPEDNQFIEDFFERHSSKGKLGEGQLVGIFPGAGHPSRRWPLERFGELAERLQRNERARLVIVAGPEEQKIINEIRRVFGRSVIYLERLTIPQLAAACARLAVFVSNDTGPLHIAAAVGTPVVMLLGHPTNKSFVPLGNHHQVIHGTTITDITTDQVYDATHRALHASRTSALFAG